MSQSNWIAFPNLDWKFDLSNSFTLFGLNIKFYGLLIAIGFSLAIFYGVKRARFFGIDPDRMIDVALIVTPLAFVGARLYYVFFSDKLAAYLADPISILKVWEGGLGIYGGVMPFNFVPTYNVIRRCTVAPRSTADGKLSVDIELETEDGE